MKVAFVTFGCRLNRAETLDLEARYRAAGHEIIDLGSVPQPSQSSGTVPKTSGSVPDLILVRGCSVTAKAQRDCEKAIAHLRTQFPTAEIRPIGCLPNAGAVPTIGSVPKNVGTVPPKNMGTVLQDKDCLPLQTSRAYLKIQDGCSGKCTFCIVPHFRGQPVSIPFDEIMVRTKSFLAAGYREIILTGCNLSLYHWSDHNLATLLAALAELGTDPGVLGTDPEILVGMNRPYEITWAERFCTAARERLGTDLALGADIITGFPGETEEDFEATRAFLERHAFSNLHVFPYSERPGTPAASMDGAVPLAVRRARAKELEKIGQTQRRAFAASFLGHEVEVCIERNRAGWTAEYLKCAFGDPRASNDLGDRLSRRRLVRGLVVRVDDDLLVAEPPQFATRPVRK